MIISIAINIIIIIINIIIVITINIVIIVLFLRIITELFWFTVVAEGKLDVLSGWSYKEPNSVCGIKWSDSVFSFRWNELLDG